MELVYHRAAAVLGRSWRPDWYVQALQVNPLRVTLFRGGGSLDMQTALLIRQGSLSHRPAVRVDRIRLPLPSARCNWGNFSLALLIIKF
jgi:hypothetical protein